MDRHNTGMLGSRMVLGERVRNLGSCVWLIHFPANRSSYWAWPGRVRRWARWLPTARRARDALRHAQRRTTGCRSGRIRRTVRCNLRWAGTRLDLLDGCDVLCVSGGVPLDLPIVQEAFRRGIRVTNDAQLFLERCPAPVLAITGSAGKTTTTSLVGRNGAAPPGGGRGSAAISAMCCSMCCRRSRPTIWW